MQIKVCFTGGSLNQQQLKGGGVMGKISSEVTWSVRTYAGVWDDCYDEPLVGLCDCGNNCNCL